MARGTITAVMPAGYGFITPSGSSDSRKGLFFHVSDLADGMEFGKQLIERRVEFDPETGPKGQRARRVRPAP